MFPLWVHEALRSWVLEVFDLPKVRQKGASRSHASHWDVYFEGGENGKLERSPGWSLVRAERSKFCIYAYVDRQAKSKVSSPKDPINNTREIHEKRAFTIARLRKDEYARSYVVMELDLTDGKTRGYWKDHTPDTEPGNPKAVNSMTRTPPDIGWDLRPDYSSGKWFKQAKITGKINNSKATMLLGSGAEVSIVDTIFARKIDCIIDESQKQECVGIGENVYTTLGRTTIKVTLAGYLLYFFGCLGWCYRWSGCDLENGLHGPSRYPPRSCRRHDADEVRFQLSGRGPPYGRSRHSLLLEDDVAIPVGDSVEVPLKAPRALDPEKLWINIGYLPSRRDLGAGDTCGSPMLVITSSACIEARTWACGSPKILSPTCQATCRSGRADTQSGKRPQSKRRPINGIVRSHPLILQNR
ncbi:LOW QUALITY PROTEIN: hypothetical protein PHMEG_0003219 [Phytophthora megakarya]|uniref:Peptidase A2 domain-containing protein n=1 Tax=Phytophthora megakarya TaxID=4795 RepID=A0A225WZ44_9STRA|nr:LOW QUALITY PROTEIN: hypothetical protein PHMEG_0003219 [Phytophthora megakarya]